MHYRNMEFPVLVAFTVLTVVYESEATEELEIKGNSINVTFYNMPMNKWTTERQNKFTSILVDEASRYCRGNADKCGLVDNWYHNGTFADSDLIVSDKQPQSEKKALKVKWFLKFPAGLTNVSMTTDLHYVLPFAALDAIAANVREKLSDGVGYYVIGIGDGVYHPPPNDQLNWIIIPVTLVVVVIVVIVAIALHCWHKQKTMKERQEKKRRRNKDVRTGGKVSPVTVMSTDEKNTNNMNGESKSSGPRRIEDDFGSKEFSGSLGTHETHIPYTAEDPYAATDQTLEIPDVSQRGGGRQLPPLESSEHPVEEEKQHRKKKKSKKEKKKRKHSGDKEGDESRRGYENPNYMEKTQPEMNIPVVKNATDQGARYRRKHSVSDNEDGGNMVTVL